MLCIGYIPLSNIYYLDCTAVCFNVDDITDFHLLFLETLINGWIKLELLSSLCSFKTNDNVANSFPISYNSNTRMRSAIRHRIWMDTSKLKYPCFPKLYSYYLLILPIFTSRMIKVHFDVQYQQHSPPIGFSVSTGVSSVTSPSYTSFVSLIRRPENRNCEHTPTT